MVTAHELGDWARCPRAWWYERHDPRAALSADALRERLAARDVHGRRGVDRRETAVLERLLARHGRFAYGAQAHRDALLHRTDHRLRRALLLVALVAAVVLAIAVWA